MRDSDKQTSPCAISLRAVCGKTSFASTSLRSLTVFTEDDNVAPGCGAVKTMVKV